MVFRSLWNTREQKSLNRFRLGTSGSPLVSFHFINELRSSSTIVCGHRDGVFDIVTQADQQGLSHVLGRFRSIETRFKQTPRSVVSAWSQERTELNIGGDSPYLSVWNATHERYIRQVATGQDAASTSLAIEPERGILSLAGFANGAVALYDRRQAQHCCVKLWSGGHKGEIEGVQMIPKGAMRELASYG